MAYKFFESVSDRESKVDVDHDNGGVRLLMMKGKKLAACATAIGNASWRQVSRVR